MALFRKTPTCPFCNKVIAEAVIDTESKIIGDNFIRWNYLKHGCNTKNELPITTKEQAETFMTLLNALPKVKTNDE